MVDRCTAGGGQSGRGNPVGYGMFGWGVLAFVGPLLALWARTAMSPRGSRGVHAEVEDDESPSLPPGTFQ
jgi:hypothetical protein